MHYTEMTKTQSKCVIYHLVWEWCRDNHQLVVPHFSQPSAVLHCAPLKSLPSFFAQSYATTTTTGSVQARKTTLSMVKSNISAMIYCWETVLLLLVEQKYPRHGDWTRSLAVTDHKSNHPTTLAYYEVFHTIRFSNGVSLSVILSSSNNQDVFLFIWFHTMIRCDRLWTYFSP